MRKIKQSKKIIIALAVIMVIGIFLRTYNFRNWVRFNDDQARDAIWTNEILSGTRSLPLLGPKAGSTEFRLGPVYYYFQYVSGRFFGGAPDKLAYPDLLFSILAIPMLFLFLKKYFNDRDSLVVTGLFSISAYVVEYSRFAWNPNSMTFFILLLFYALLELIEPKQKNKIAWAIVAGLCTGIGAQLHTLFLVIMPAMMLVFLGYVLKKGKFDWKTVWFILLFAIIPNVPQLFYEVQSGGANIMAFFSGASNTSGKNHGIVSVFVGDGICHVRENAMMLASYGNVTDNFIDCHPIGLRNYIAEQQKAFGMTGSIAAILGFVISAVFSLGGYWLIWRAIKKETDREKKNFLMLSSLYIVVSFFVLAGLESVLTSRYFLIVEIVPFIMLGLWIEFLREKFGERGTVVVAVLVLALAVYNLFAINMTFAQYAGADMQDVSKPESVNLEDQEFFARYIEANREESLIIVINDNIGDLFGLRKALRFLTEGKLDIKEVGVNHDIKLTPGTPYFSMDLAGVSEKEELQKANLPGYRITGSATRGRFSIFKFSAK
ncbi:MAG TPA: glycosyltransferase family 39 protein [Patescibacteria group bacterium]